MNKHIMNTIGFVEIITLMITMLISCDSDGGGGTTPVGTSNLYAWGSNEFGQLGIGNNADSAVPAVIGTKTWKLVSVGGTHTVAIDDAGKLYAWGDNGVGQLGNGKSGIEVKSTTPIAIEPTKTWKLVSAGASHTMAIDTDNHLYAWGGNGYGRLGNNSTTNSSTPIAIEATKTWKLVSAGDVHTMAIDTDEHLFAWGDNSNGQLGNNSTTNSSTPIAIEATKTWKLVSTGETINIDGISTGYTMAIDTLDNLYAWGANQFGELGITTTNDEGNEVPVGNTLTPSKVGTKTWKLVSAGDSHTMAIDSDDHLFVWGDNSNGQLGNGNTTQQNTSVSIEPTKTWKLVSAGNGYTMAIDSNNHLFAWGLNFSGQIGNGNKIQQTTPVAIEPTKTWTQISAGSRHTMGIIIE